MPASWLRMLLRSLGELLTKLVQPYLRFFDEHIPPLGGISFAPVVAVFVLYLVQYGIIMLTRMIGY